MEVSGGTTYRHDRRELDEVFVLKHKVNTKNYKLNCIDPTLYLCKGIAFCRFSPRGIGYSLKEKEAYGVLFFKLSVVFINF